eukprot:403351872
MYIGPWQEFKLAKILQIKDKIEKEEKEANKLDNSNQQNANAGQRIPPKAYSTGARLQPNNNNAYEVQSDQNNVFKTQSNMRANSRQNAKRSQASSEHQYKFKLAPEYSAPPKQIPVLRGNHSDPRNPNYKMLQTGPLKQQQQQLGPYSQYTKQNSLNLGVKSGSISANNCNQNLGKHSPTVSNYSYALSNAHSTQYTQQPGIVKQIDSFVKNQQGPQSMNSKGSYLSTTQSASNKASLSEYRAQLRNRDKSSSNGMGGNNLPIEVHYEQWNRFENFLKFAGKKEIRDRLKELDPPPLENYIDPDVIDKIRAASKPPNVPRKNIIKPGEKGGISAKEENRLRIEKMKQLYGLYKQFEEEENKDQKEEQQQITPITQNSAQEFINNQQSFSQLQNQQQLQPNNFILPEVKNTPQRLEDQLLRKQQIQQQQIMDNRRPVKLPELPKNKIDQQPQQVFQNQQIVQQTQQNQKPSLYNFYQKIIDRNIPNTVEKDEKFKHPNYQVLSQQQQNVQQNIQQDSQQNNKFQSQYAQPQLHQVTQEDIREDLSEDGDKVNQNDVLNSSIRKRGDPSQIDPNDRSIRKSYDESEIDGLIKWANNLPDDIANQSQTSFFKKGII